MNFDRLNDYVESWPPWVFFMTTAAVALVALAALGILIWTTYKAIRDATNSKLEIGFAVGQTVVTVVIIQGVYEFFHKILNQPTLEAALVAVSFESAVWVSVGFIFDHARRTVALVVDGQTVIGEDGQPKMVHLTGWGMAAAPFWIFILSGGALAIIGSGNVKVAVGRAFIIVVGVTLWFMRLKRVTHRSNRRSRFAYSPMRLAERWGWYEPAPEQQVDENREWKIAQLTRAIRLMNSEKKRHKGKGKKLLTRLAESTTPDVLRAAQHRYAAVYALEEEALITSPVMVATIEAAKTTSTAIAEILQHQAIAAAAVAGGQVPKQLDRGPDRSSDRAPDRAPDRQRDRVDPDTKARDKQVGSISDQAAKDQLAARTILMIVQREMEKKLGEPVEYTSWDDVRGAITANPDVISINKIEALSKTSGCPMGKPKITRRILPDAEKLHPLPDDLEIQAAAG